MAYATQSDIVTLYGDDALVVADIDHDGTPDPAVVAAALADATGEIDSYLAVRYRLPLPVVPLLLQRLCVEIALYRLSLSAAALTTELRQRYEDALAHLRRLADGKAALVLPVDPEEPLADAGPRPIVTGGPERLFSRDQMRNL